MKYKPWMQFCPRWCCIDDHPPPIDVLLSIMMAENNKTTQRCDYHTATAAFGVMDLYDLSAAIVEDAAHHGFISCWMWYRRWRRIRFFRDYFLSIRGNSYVGESGKEVSYGW